MRPRRAERNDLSSAMSKIIDRVYGKYSKASRARLEAFKQALKFIDAAMTAGDIVECGVWQGGHIILARYLSPQRKCWLYDTFDGMTEPGEFDGEKAHEHWTAKGGRRWAACSVRQVRDNLIAEKVYNPDLVRFIVGDVRETLRDDDLPDKVALLHLDTDFYDSTKIEMQMLWPRLVAGGVLIVDDYGHWPGARRAVNEYFETFGIQNNLHRIDYTAYQMSKR
jgi:O-methyltransferase